MRDDAYYVDCVAFLRTSGNMSHRHDHAGVISFANGSRELECTIHNSSASWAELRAEGVGIVPHRFELQEREGAATRGNGDMAQARRSRRQV